MDRLLWCSLLLNFLKLTGMIWVTVCLRKTFSIWVNNSPARVYSTNFLYYHTLSGRGWSSYGSAIIIPGGSTNPESCLSQPDEVLWRKTGQSVDLPCAISAQCSGPNWKYEWLTCKERFCFSVELHEKLDKYKLDGASLHITALRANDSGIYHCAAVSAGGQGSQHVGLGTTLVVKGRRGKKIASVLKNQLICQWNQLNVTDWSLSTFRKDSKNGEKHLSLDMFCPCDHLQPGSGDANCENGKEK